MCHVGGKQAGCPSRHNFVLYTDPFHVYKSHARHHSIVVVVDRTLLEIPKADERYLGSAAFGACTTLRCLYCPSTLGHAYVHLVYLLARRLIRCGAQALGVN